MDKSVIPYIGPQSTFWTTVLHKLSTLFDKDLDSAEMNCDPFVRVLLNGEQILETEVRKNTEEFDVDESVTTTRIKRDKDIIDIEIWDHNEDKPPALIYKISGTVDDWIGRIEDCDTREQVQNCIRANIIWVDERKELKAIQRIQFELDKVKKNQRDDVSRNMNALTAIQRGLES